MFLAERVGFLQVLTERGINPGEDFEASLGSRSR